MCKDCDGDERGGEAPMQTPAAFGPTPNSAGFSAGRPASTAGGELKGKEDSFFAKLGNYFSKMFDTLSALEEIEFIIRSKVMDPRPEGETTNKEDSAVPPSEAEKALLKSSNIALRLKRLRSNLQDINNAL
jgi:hypothetical protein